MRRFRLKALRRNSVCPLVKAGFIAALARLFCVELPGGADSAPDSYVDAGVQGRRISVCQSGVEVLVLAVIDVPSDGNCMFHALAVSTGLDGGRLRRDIADYLEQEAYWQDGFEEVWRAESAFLRGAPASCWGGHTALVAFSLMQRVRVILHMPSLCNASVMEARDVSHSAVQQDNEACTVHVWYDGVSHYKGLTPVNFAIGWPAGVDLAHRATALTSMRDPSSWAENVGVGGRTAQVQPLKGDANSLDIEVGNFVQQVMAPGSEHHLCDLAVWQKDLQERCAGRDCACEFWHAVVFQLDLGLHVEFKVFAALLKMNGWPYIMLDDWQRRLRGQTWKSWIRRRMWFDLIHGVDLTVPPAQVRSQLARLNC